MFASVFGFLFLLCGSLLLLLPFMLIELSRYRDWLMGGLFLFSGFFLIEENDLFRGSINLLVISITILLGKMMMEIFQSRWFQLSIEEKKRIGTFARWLESLQQLGQIFAVLGSGFFELLKNFRNQPKTSLKEKKWVHPDLKEESKKKNVDSPNLVPVKKNKKNNTTEKEESS